MHVIACQLDCVWEDKPANYEQVKRLLDRAGVERGSLIVLPEMFATGFSLNAAAIAEDEHGPTERFMADLAGQYGAAVLGGVANRSASSSGGVAEQFSYRNQAVAIAPDGSPLARYSKLHPFTPGGESVQYQPGSRIALFSWQQFNVAPLVCYDLRFPEAFRHAALTGAQLLVVIANFPASRVNHWTTLLTARAIENQAFVVGVNRCGADPVQAYPGRSLVIDPKGQILADAGDGPKTISADLDRSALIEYRAGFPLLRDARADFLGIRN